MAAAGRPRLSPAESELREHLLKAAAAAERVLPPARCTLQEWVERKMSGELILRVESGIVVFTKPGAEAGKRSSPPPPPPPSKQAAAVDTEAFLNGLPQDSFTPAEDKLREAILSMIANGPVAKSKVFAHKEAQPALRAFLPRSVPLEKWLEARIGAEVSVYEDAGGQQMLRLSSDDDDGQEAVVEEEDPEQARSSARDAFFASLPEASFKEEEEALRLAIFDFLATWRSKELATLSKAVDNAGVKAAQEALLPPAVQLKEWLEYRIGGEMELKSTESGQLAINLLPPARTIVTARYKEMEAKRKADAAAEAKRKLPVAPAVAPMSQAAKKAFLEGLPDDELKTEELRLRQVLLDVVNASKRPIPISEVSAKPQVKEAIGSLLPPGLPVEDWIEERIGGEIDVRKEQGRQGQAQTFIASMNAAPPPPAQRVEALSPAELEARKEAFFKKLPADSFAPAEEKLREAIFSHLENWKGIGPPVLSQAQELIPIFQKLGKGATLQDWIDKRIGGEVETREHGSEIAFSMNGRMDDLISAEASKGNGKKRKADGPQGGSKGKGKAHRKGY